MSGITIIDLPKDLDEQLTVFAEKVFANPNQFTITEMYYPTSRPKVDEYDPTLPILNDEFILNHDLNSVDWKKTGDLHTCAFKWLYDVSFPPAQTSIQMFKYLEQVTGKNFAAHRGNFYYPHTGYMGWHTNSNVPGTRIYIAYSNAEQGSYFKYVDRSKETPEIITSWDKKGWTARMFHPTADPSEYLWHCVGAPSATRMSFGFLFT